MSTERLNASPSILPRVLADHLWGERDFFLIDVGASGGIEYYWAAFGDRLRAIGFEPLLAEVQRLQEQARGTKIQYEPAFVTCRDFDQLFPPERRKDRVLTKNNDPFARVSAVRALELLQVDYTEQVFNAGAPAVYTERRVVLDDFFPAYKHGTIDFIKVDTDGHDFEVVLGADALTRNGGALGFSIEAQFHGPSHEYANTFANIDGFMRRHGFSLFDLDVYRYSRSALPAAFVYDIPAQTLTGQVLWGEAVYFRDLGNADYEKMWPYYLITRERVIKLACLFDLFGLPDCAAELLQTRRQLVGDSCDALLDDLAAPRLNTRGAYAEYIQRFESDPQTLYPSRRQPSTIRVNAAPVLPTPAPVVVPEPPPQMPPDQTTETSASELKALRARTARLREKMHDLQERLRRRDEKIQQLRERIDADRPRQGKT